MNQTLEQIADEVRAELRDKRDYFYPKKHREKYAGHEFVKVCGVAVRKLSDREIAEFQAVIDRGPLKPIRLGVTA